MTLSTGSSSRALREPLVARWASGRALARLEFGEGTRATYAPKISTASGSEGRTVESTWYTKVVYRDGVPGITIGPDPTTFDHSSRARRRMLRLDRITLREIRLALKEPFRISSGVMSERRILLLELTDADGATAWAECVAFTLPNYTPETIDTAWLAIREWLAPRLLGRSLSTAPPRCHDLLAENIRGHNMAKAALEMGCWALAAEIARRVAVAAARRHARRACPTGVSLGIQPAPALLVERAVAAVAAGYRKIKLKIQPGQDVEYVRAVRAALGRDVEHHGRRERRVHARRRRPSRRSSTSSAC